MGEVDAELEQEEEYIFFCCCCGVYTIGSAIFEEGDGNSLRSVTVVSILFTARWGQADKGHTRGSS